jgi:hypothetical protein
MNNNTMNIKTAYRLFVSNVEEIGDKKKNLLLAAQYLGISVSIEKALNPKNYKVLQRTKFWETLRYRTELLLKEGVIKALQETGQLFVGREFFLEEDKKVVSAISSDKFTVKDIDGLHCSNHNVLFYHSFDMSVLPGDDPEGESFWKEYE